MNRCTRPAPCIEWTCSTYGSCCTGLFSRYDDDRVLLRLDTCGVALPLHCARHFGGAGRRKSGAELFLQKVWLKEKGAVPALLITTGQPTDQLAERAILSPGGDYRVASRMNSTVDSPKNDYWGDRARKSGGTILKRSSYAATFPFRAPVEVNVVLILALTWARPASWLFALNLQIMGVFT